MGVRSLLSVDSRRNNIKVQMFRGPGIYVLLELVTHISTPVRYLAK